MDLAQRKLNFIEQFMNITSVEKLDKLERFFKKEIVQEKDIWDEIPKNIQQLIEKSIEDSNSGKVKPHKEVMKDIKAKFNIA